MDCFQNKQELQLKALLSFFLNKVLLVKVKENCLFLNLNVVLNV